MNGDMGADVRVNGGGAWHREDGMDWGGNNVSEINSWS